MKRDGLLSNSRRSLASLLLLISTGLLIPTPAQSAELGLSPCVQTVDNISGVSVFQDGNSCYVAFKSTVTYLWTPPTGVSKIDLLVVAGGGGGGSRHAGGGGAGGLINSTNTTINSSALSITVGGGGAGGAATSSGGGNDGSNGVNSVVSGGGIVTKLAYGGGGGSYTSTSGSGGSSGGGGCCIATVGTAVSGQGNTGSLGATNNSTYWVGGGGGGAGAGGGTSSSSTAGAGGAGAAISWISTSAQSNLVVGQNVTSQVFFAGGGGGGTDRNTITAGAGGNGGGGAGVNITSSAGNNATANTGGGGGGAGVGSPGGTAKGGDGGSGVVVIRYNIPLLTSSATSSIAENTSTSTNAATITVSESSTFTLQSLLDYSFFNLVISDSVTARIRFASSPDYEAFADNGANNEYDISIRATNSSGNYRNYSIKITLTDVIESATISPPSISGTIYKGREITITVNVNVPGKVRFFVSGKRIANCLNRATSGSYPSYSASCSWKPALSGPQLVKATITPTEGGLSAVTSNNSSVYINKRTNNR